MTLSGYVTVAGQISAGVRICTGMTDAQNAFELKGTSFTLSVLKLATSDIALLRQGLEQKIAQAPKFFVHAPVVLELSQLHDADIDFVALQKLCRELGLIPVGIAEASESQQHAAWEAGLAIMNPAKLAKAAPQKNTQQDSHKQSPTEQSTQTPPNGGVASEPTMFINRPIRSGQQIYAKGGDLVIFGAVSPGAEVIADGDIHVYGALRGRAIAGASGGGAARVCCLQLTPELVSISGNYWLSDQIPSEHWGSQASVKWDGDQLQVQSNA